LNNNLAWQNSDDYEDPNCDAICADPGVPLEGQGSKMADTRKVIIIIV